LVRRGRARRTSPALCMGALTGVMRRHFGVSSPATSRCRPSSCVRCRGDGTPSARRSGRSNAS
jgi:hypothetical protein